MTPLRRRFDEARLAFMLLTRLPVGKLRDPAPSLAEAQWAYPLVGLVVGIVTWAVLHGAIAIGIGPYAAALAAIAATILVTGGLHQDGLADFVDGIGGGRDRTHCLEIMRDSRIGSYGVVALILAVGTSAAALGDIAGYLTLATALTIAVSSRLAMLAVLLALPAARGDGLGFSAAAGLRMACVPGAMLVTGLTLTMGWSALVVIITAAVATCIIAVLAVRHIGGQTGDVLGAVQAVSEALAWLALSAALSP
ncbi:MAG: adenosylcobinamide-GDP ribazoletransferase [Pseudomonadota bacterium]